MPARLGCLWLQADPRSFRSGSGRLLNLGLFCLYFENRPLPLLVEFKFFLSLTQLYDIRMNGHPKGP